MSSRVALRWQFPIGAGTGVVVKHRYPVPPLPVLRAISVGRHEDERPAYDRISFTFTGTFPSYALEYDPYVSVSRADPSGKPVRVEGDNTLLVRFTRADAHDVSGTPTVPSRPIRVGYPALAGYAQLGDFEGVVAYAVGNYGPGVVSPNVRAVEVKRTDVGHGYVYIVAIDVQTAALGRTTSCPSAATLLAALRRTADDPASVLGVHDIACTGGWAIAAVEISDEVGAYTSTGVFQEQDGEWTAVDRSRPCSTGQLPPALEQVGCHSN